MQRTLIGQIDGTTLLLKIAACAMSSNFYKQSGVKIITSESYLCDDVTIAAVSYGGGLNWAIQILTTDTRLDVRHPCHDIEWDFCSRKKKIVFLKNCRS